MSKTVLLVAGALVVGYFLAQPGALPGVSLSGITASRSSPSPIPSPSQEHRPGYPDRDGWTVFPRTRQALRDYYADPPKETER